jgi:4-hydroxy-4-methyl-2-oxoglutarate aldolase
MTTTAPRETAQLIDKFRYFRTTDVTDALDALGRQDLTLMDERVRPLWEGIRFWGHAVTVRALPTNVRMPVLSPEEAIRSHAIWFDQYGGMGIKDAVRPGCVVVTATGGCPEVGIWGSNNAMEMIALGAVGIVTDGYCRDTDEVIRQRTPVACRARGRTIIPGRVTFTGVNEPVACGNVLVRRGDIVGCDGDGVIVVPQELVVDVIKIAKGILIDDAPKRRKLYEQLGLPMDETVDVEAMQAFYADV